MYIRIRRATPSYFVGMEKGRPHFLRSWVKRTLARTLATVTLFLVWLSSNKVNQRMLLSFEHWGIFICLHFFGRRLFFSSLKFLVTEWGKRCLGQIFPVCLPEMPDRRIVCIRHHWQVRTRQISRHHSGISSWWSRYRGMISFSRAKGRMQGKRINLC